MAKSVPVPPPPKTAARGMTALCEAVPLAPAALQAQMQSVQAQMNRRIGRTLENGFAAARLLRPEAATTTWDELQQLQGAVVRRLQQQQENWLSGCAALVHEYARTTRATTMSRLVEQQINLIAQSVLLFSNQTAGLLALQENIEVDFGYWVSEKLQPESP